jgi:uncharacterized protein (TIGR02246 family)
MMEPWELAARESIRDLVARYNASGDSGRFDETLALFTSDACVTILPDERYRGREEIRTLLTGAAKRTRASTGHAPVQRVRLIRHFTATHQIDIESRATAVGRCYYAVLTNVGLDHWGRYVDRYVCDEEQWRFSERTISIDGAVPGGWGERAVSA